MMWSAFEEVLLGWPQLLEAGVDSRLSREHLLMVFKNQTQLEVELTAMIAK